MTPFQSHQPIPKRAALGDGMARVNTLQGGEPSRPPMIHHGSHKPENQLPVNDAHEDVENRRTSRNTDTVYPHAHHNNDRRAALLALEGKKHNPNRDSLYSNASTNASDPGGRRERKTHIGPWNLGKTLGKGATARVRLARHTVTGAHAAVKIVQKGNSAMTASGSLAQLTRADAVNCGPNSRRMPYGIEREVAIMKLIKHPNILKLQDIWENRSEIYLVLEYADKGELFEHIVACQALPEAETMKYFRQMLSAIGYCHQFNICHRDLKPENILLTSDMDIRLADFGMAALQQNDDHRLATSCGSPHYAAPEVIAGTPYKGDKIDVWSLGVILYACLCGHLPFDNNDIPTLLKIIRRGKFTLPGHLSPDAKDLLHRILVVDPQKRLSIKQIWKHPLVKRYEYLDNFDCGRLYGQLALRQLDPHLRKRSDIDTELLRSIRSLWHSSSEEELIAELLTDRPTDQKFFYALFSQHRTQQLENYVPDGVRYSTSDYHHMRPLAQVPRLSTRQFSAVDSHGIRRQISKFTVITNSGAPSRQGSRSTYVHSEAGETIRSYDPYRASRPQNLTADGVSKANIIVHRSMADRLHEDRMHSRGFGSVASSRRSGAHPSLLATRRYGTGTRSSLASSAHSRSRVGSSKAKTGLKYKRGVSFSRIQGGQLAGGYAGMKSPLKKNSPRKLRNPVHRASPPRDLYIRSKKVTDSVAKSGLSPRKSPTKSPKKRIAGQNQTFHEDVRHISRSLAKDCDMAFNFDTSALSTITSSLNDGSHARDSTPLTSFEQRDSSVIHYRPNARNSGTATVDNGRTSQRYDSRPLPPPPARSESVVNQLAAARQALEERKAIGNATYSPGHFDRMSNHIDRLMVSGDERDKRAVSAPSPARKQDKSIASAFRYSDSNAAEDFAIRQGSAQTAPESRLLQTLFGRDGGLDGSRFTARVVPPSSPGLAAGDGWASDKSSFGRPRQASPRTEYFTSDVPTHVAHDAHGRESGQSLSDRVGLQKETAQKKKLNWFKRNAKDGAPRGVLQDLTNVAEKPAPELKKKSFGLGGLFKNKKRTVKDDDENIENPYALAADSGIDDSNLDNDDEWEHYQRPGKGKDIASRQVEPRQTFLARLFRVKPAVDYVCFNLSRRRARQEISAMMKQWRQFGITDVVTDKQRQMVFAKVGKKNSLDLKEVSFAVEVMAVIEHGRRGYLSIARFTQEAGAASSFEVVVKTVKDTMGARGYLVKDERKARMMIKTLQSA